MWLARREEWTIWLTDKNHTTKSFNISFSLLTLTVDRTSAKYQLTTFIKFNVYHTQSYLSRFHHLYSTDIIRHELGLVFLVFLNVRKLLNGVFYRSYALRDVQTIKGKKHFFIQLIHIPGLGRDNRQRPRCRRRRSTVHTTPWDSRAACLRASAGTREGSTASAGDCCRRLEWSSWTCRPDTEECIYRREWLGWRVLIGPHVYQSNYSHTCRRTTVVENGITLLWKH